MAKTSQTALKRYMARRGHEPVDSLDFDSHDPVPAPVEPDSRRKTRQLTLLSVLLVALVFLGWRAWDSLPGDPIGISYEVDLKHAPQGELVVTLMLEGDLPDQLELATPPGVFGSMDQGLALLRPSAHALDEDGLMGKPLTVDRTQTGFLLGTRGAERVGFIYRVQLAAASASETDIRRHISTPVDGGVRFAGFEVFLEPVNAEVDKITVSLRNPEDLPVLVPWPALVRSEDRRRLAEAPALAEAHLGFGQGYRPADAAPDGTTSVPDRSQTEAAPVPRNLFFHPRDLADLNNALLVCGNIRTLSSQAGDCVIQLATDRQWSFDDRDVLEMVRRIARTEMGFFGSAPTEQITVLLGANAVRAEEGFDVYGVHTGSSVLVMLDPETTWGMLEEQAASVIAHEMFHGWLGEAITQLEPDTLWFTEGATTWYSARMLTAAGIWTPDHARGVLLDRLMRDYVDNPWRGKVSIAEAAADVMGDAGQVRYSYAGGVAACMALDQWLQNRTERLRPLDEVLRYLYENCGEEGFSRAALEEAVLAVTGIDCKLWLDRHVYDTEALPAVDRLI